MEFLVLILEIFFYIYRSSECYATPQQRIYGARLMILISRVAVVQQLAAQHRQISSKFHSSPTLSIQLTKQTIDWSGSVELNRSLEF